MYNDCDRIFVLVRNLVFLLSFSMFIKKERIFYLVNIYKVKFYVNNIYKVFCFSGRSIDLKIKEFYIESLMIWLKFKFIFCWRLLKSFF